MDMDATGFIALPLGLWLLMISFGSLQKVMFFPSMRLPRPSLHHLTLVHQVISFPHCQKKGNSKDTHALSQPCNFNEMIVVSDVSKWLNPIFK